MNLTSGDPSSNHPWMADKAPTPSKIQPQLQNLQLGRGHWWHQNVSEKMLENMLAVDIKTSWMLEGRCDHVSHDNVRFFLCLIPLFISCQAAQAKLQRERQFVRNSPWHKSKNLKLRRIPKLGWNHQKPKVTWNQCPLHGRRSMEEVNLKLDPCSLPSPGYLPTSDMPKAGFRDCMLQCLDKLWAELMSQTENTLCSATMEALLAPETSKRWENCRTPSREIWLQAQGWCGTGHWHSVKRKVEGHDASPLAATCFHADVWQGFWSTASTANRHQKNRAFGSS